MASILTKTVAHADHERSPLLGARVGQRAEWPTVVCYTEGCQQHQACTEHWQCMGDHDSGVQGCEFSHHVACAEKNCGKSCRGVHGDYYPSLTLPQYAEHYARHRAIYERPDAKGRLAAGAGLRADRLRRNNNPALVAVTLQEEKESVPDDLNSMDTGSTSSYSEITSSNSSSTQQLAMELRQDVSVPKLPIVMLPLFESDKSFLEGVEYRTVPGDYVFLNSDIDSLVYFRHRDGLLGLELKKYYWCRQNGNWTNTVFEFFETETKMYPYRGNLPVKNCEKLGPGFYKGLVAAYGSPPFNPVVINVEFTFPRRILLSDQSVTRNVFIMKDLDLSFRDMSNSVIHTSTRDVVKKTMRNYYGFFAENPACRSWRAQASDLITELVNDCEETVWVMYTQHHSEQSEMAREVAFETSNTNSQRQRFEQPITLGERGWKIVRENAGLFCCAGVVTSAFCVVTGGVGAAFGWKPAAITATAAGALCCTGMRSRFEALRLKRKRGTEQDIVREDRFCGEFYEEAYYRDEDCTIELPNRKISRLSTLDIPIKDIRNCIVMYNHQEIENVQQRLHAGLFPDGDKDIQSFTYCHCWFYIGLFAPVSTPSTLNFMVVNLLKRPLLSGPVQALRWARNVDLPRLFIEQYDLIQIMDFDFEMWLAARPPSKSREYRNYCNQNDLRFPLNNADFPEIGVCGTFGKVDEFLPSHKPKMRCIVNFPVSYVVRGGPYIDFAVKRLKNIFSVPGWPGHDDTFQPWRLSNGLQCFPVWGAGRTDLELSYWYMWTFRALPEDSLSVMCAGDDAVICLHVGERYIYFESDYSSYDQSQSMGRVGNDFNGPLHYMLNLMLRLGVPAILVTRFHQHFEKQRFRVNDNASPRNDVDITLEDPMMPTGAPFTTFSNTVCNIAALCMAFGVLNLPFYDLDTNQICQTVAATLAELGFEAKMFDTSLENLTFLKGKGYRGSFQCLNEIPINAPVTFPLIRKNPGMLEWEGFCWAPLLGRLLKVGRSKRLVCELYPTETYPAAALRFMDDVCTGFSPFIRIPILRALVDRWSGKSSLKPGEMNEFRYWVHGNGIIAKSIDIRPIVARYGISETDLETVELMIAHSQIGDAIASWILETIMKIDYQGDRESFNEGDYVQDF